jgi:alkylhydroperoxidase/carboxymuconolactone decarboxylase family protein YurZ
MEPEYRDLFERGSRTRERVLGSTGAERSGDEFGRTFQETSNALAWGGIWSRPGLEDRDRCLLTVALVAALGITDVLPMHVRGALRNGVTREELAETFLHTGLYAGFPRASVAMRIAGETLQALDEPGSGNAG